MRKMNEKITRRTEENTTPDSNSDTHVSSDRGSTTSTPRWVKVFGVIALVLVLLFVILHLTGNSPFSHMGHMGHMGNMSYGLDDHTTPIGHGVQ